MTSNNKQFSRLRLENESSNGLLPRYLIIFYKDSRYPTSSLKTGKTELGMSMGNSNHLFSGSSNARFLLKNVLKICLLKKTWIHPIDHMWTLDNRQPADRIRPAVRFDPARETF
ncbi:hypothetical protein EVAR_65033_1 [Eumeta japonica]|uniref:Uncharacterized protein n=1 Tax=Eumeta variegata TaxID=151549 RepID=A0A4C1YW82_EUMVA|nr:hypothetical protein EVAR_65033_1 [Eumeta japonica]